LGWREAPTLEEFLTLLATNGVSREAQMMVAEKVRELGWTPSLLDLALAMSAVEQTAKQIGTGVECLTIHGAKGREWDHVFLVGMEDETIPGHRKDANIEEERRLAYVGATRARKGLYVTCCSSRVAQWGPRPIQKTTPSRFISEMLP
jgi:superfamily I DNA/RNA helicase